MTRKLILDTDGGVDDAQALLMLIAAGRAPDAVTTVFGNVDRDTATRNILAVLQIAGRHDIPVHAGAARPLVGDVVDAHRIHGEDGLGGAVRPAAIADRASVDAIGFLIATLREAAAAGDAVDILAIGPLTNLALALRLAPDIVGGIAQLTVMGGTLIGRGNVTPAAEFNIHADPEAAGIVFAAPLKVVVVPWETCATHLIRGDAVDELFAGVPDGAVKTFSRSLADHSRRVAAGFGGGDRLRFVDPLAAALVIAPDIGSRFVEASIAVETAPGMTRGMSLVDPTGRLRTPKAMLLEAADLPRVVELYRRSISFGPATVPDG